MSRSDDAQRSQIILGPQVGEPFSPIAQLAGGPRSPLFKIPKEIFENATENSTIFDLVEGQFEGLNV